MSVLLPSAFLIGAGLGLRFKVLILIPVNGVALIAILAVSLISEARLADSMTVAVLVSAGLQFGYISGSIARYAPRLSRIVGWSKFPRRVESAGEAGAPLTP